MLQLPILFRGGFKSPPPSCRVNPGAVCNKSICKIIPAPLKITFFGPFCSILRKSINLLCVRWTGYLSEDETFAMLGIDGGGTIGIDIKIGKLEGSGSFEFLTQYKVNKITKSSSPSKVKRY